MVVVAGGAVGSDERGLMTGSAGSLGDAAEIAVRDESVPLSRLVGTRECIWIGCHLQRMTGLAPLTLQ